ncbi:uncharacterized protein Triagg1_189 [Trichoderma aggressivum f. europaeum]|uniref:NACHT domain-containing protein n=1 Tax=Trichoderma aggressivum f. europaeum TaxID=173218 RepID=A0AAE1IN01_9HYPO|nr:hypothetical protein Triagg1_189 [Trichoderma aggressivum f. europaeum]
MGLGKLKEKLRIGISKRKDNQGGTSIAQPVQEDSGSETNTSSIKKPNHNDLVVESEGSSRQSKPISMNHIDKSNLPEKSLPNLNENVESIRELWSLAYERLRREDPQLINDYENKARESLTAGLGYTIGSKTSIRERMDAILRSKMDENNRDAWKIKFGGSEVQVKNLVQPVLGVVNWANEYITGALKPNPYASIAWVGVSLILPLFMHPSEQGTSLAKGLEYISSLIVQSRMREDLYVRRYEATTHGRELPQLSHVVYKDSLEMLYRSILRFQATSYCYYAHNAAFRLGLDIVKWDDWSLLLGQIQEQERQFAAVENLWRDMKYDEESSAAERRHQETLHHWGKIGTDLSSLRSAVERAQDESSRRHVLRWLCDVDPSEMYNAARDKHKAGTGDWLTKESEEFKAWEASPASLLWLHGKAGSGKSVLSSVVIKHLQDQNATDPSTALAYFFFSFSDLEKQKVNNMLSSLVKQLCSRRPDTPPPIQSLNEYMEKGQRPDTQTLEAMLTAVARGFSAVHIVIDALDECPTLQGERKKLLSSLRRIITAAPANFHVLCTSRKEADIDAIMSFLLSPSSNTAAIDLTIRRDVLDRDIGMFIDLTLASEEYSSWPEVIKKEARDSLIEKADGMFQYVFFQLEALQQLSSASLVRKALQELPTGLDATYDRLLLSLDLAFQSQIISCLKWLAFSNEVLLLEQLAEIFILYPNRTLPFDEEGRLFHSADVLKYLSSLIVVQENWEQDSGTSAGSSDGCFVAYVRLAHFSVKEYLVSNRIAEGSAKVFSFGEADAHLHIAHCCLAYHLQHTATTEYNRWELKLMSYAAANWPLHLEMVPRASWPAEVTQVATRALAARSASLDLMIEENKWVHYYAKHSSPTMRLRPQCYTAQRGFLQLTEMIFSHMNIYSTQEDLNVALHDAAYGGSIAVVQFCLGKGAEVNSEREFFGDALQAAAYMGHDTIVNILLDKGADINAQRGNWGSALQAAADGARPHVLKLLVSRGADIDLPSNESGCVLTSAMRFGSHLYWDCFLYLVDAGANLNRRGGDIYGTALHKAAADQHLSTHFHLLLERGADVNAPGGEYGYPLQAACAQSDRSQTVTTSEIYQAVKLLLDRGADVNAKGGKYGNALQAACAARTKDYALITLLLDRGADVNAKGGKYGNALQAVCAGSYYSYPLTSVKLLIRRGADINAEGGHYGTALQAACGNSGKDVVQILLEKGADVTIQGGEYGSALAAASGAWSSAETVQLLLDHGADINATATGGEIGNAINAVIHSRNTKLLGLLLDGGADIDAQGGIYGTALQRACAEGSLEMVRLLLTRGANVNAQGGKYGTALQAVCAHAFEYNSPTITIFNLLLEYGADVHTQGGSFGSTWHAAAAQTESDILSALQQLLDRGVDVNDSRGTQHPTALQAALAFETRSNHYAAVDRIRFLLDRGADASLAAGIYGFPLQSACAIEFGGYVAAFLLDNCSGLDVNRQGGLFGSALQAAAWAGQTGSVKILLSKGADVNARGGKYGSALNAAVVKGYWDIVEDADEAWLSLIREESGQGAIESMTPAPGKPIERTETADEYGRRENCFKNHRRHPFTFQSHVTDIQSARETAEKDGFVSQPGLKMVPLPNPQLTGDVFDQHQHHRENLEKLLHDSPSKISLSASNSLTKELLFPVGELDLGSCHESDLQEYLDQVHTKRYSDPFKQWIPFACTRPDKDESISFPPGLTWLWELLHRELDKDAPDLSEAAANLVSEQSKSLIASEHEILLLQQTPIKPYQYSCLDPISPPLSPVSDDTAPFIPNSGAAVVDLVSEPSSPDRIVLEAIQRDMDSDPIISSTFMTSPIAGELPQLFQTCYPLFREAEVEAPVVLTSSDTLSETNALTDIHLPLIGDDDESVSKSLEETGNFEDAFMTLLEDRHYYANQLVNQESFYPADSLCRATVPLLDFDIPPPEWSLRHFTAKTHFAFLRKSIPHCFNILSIPRDPSSESSLRWAVFPLDKMQPIMVDEIAVADDIIAKYLSLDSTSLLSSLDFVSIKPSLDVLCIQQDEEVESVYSLNDEPDEAPPASTQHHENPNWMNLEQGNKTCISEDSHKVNRPTRRKLDDDGPRLLPKSYDTSATSILLHNFMELRGMKRPRLGTEPAAMSQYTVAGTLPSIPRSEISATNDRDTVPLQMAEEMPPVPIPYIEIPSEKASFIISVDLARPILRKLENMWAPEKLIDVDFSRHNTTVLLPGVTQSKEVVSPLSFEADISLSPSTGIIITNILKVKQRSLPGSQSQTPLRERVQKVSQRYETLIVLVSESQPKGEYMGTMAPSDTAAYAEFSSFAVALDGDVDVHFIPGATETMASWVLAFMCRYSPRSAALSRFLSSEETPWEIFLRRAGMNIIAAKVLSKTLFEQGGVSGLAVFLNMPVPERVARFGPLVGGEKGLLLTAKVIDRRWGD